MRAQYDPFRAIGICSVSWSFELESNSSAGIDTDP
jgi:hypothetical protein